MFAAVCLRCPSYRNILHRKLDLGRAWCRYSAASATGRGTPDGHPDGRRGNGSGNSGKAWPYPVGYDAGKKVDGGKRFAAGTATAAGGPSVAS
ncbi:MAG: hypothetical protein ACT4P2_15700 [Pseudomonadota bacterium]